ncbi:uncharacterized protein N7484_000238 [Penicillium longicatenatum]|uniref:uncharacterized protein n=1 Tax=Penicillium longicatenatum TaxID=1561947 RepID=UPI002546B8A8|nr:uncharacterized protein N7484_000238 [Penicillium longicatenatum]KAJ5660866.1 hypothetical protein N7484_000238 [Penicillium longicatenatum]
MTVDPAIEALFGPPPSNINLNDTSVGNNNRGVIAMLCVAALAVITRFITRITFRNPILADDYIIIIALVGQTTLSTGNITVMELATGSTFGASHHVWSISLSALEETYYLLYIYPYIYAGACTATRISILIFYHRIFSPFDSWMKWAVVFGWFQTLTYPIYLWTCMGCLCTPRKCFWLQFGGTLTGTCLDVAKFFIGAGILNMLNDFILLIIPFPRIAKLQMSIKKKMAIGGIMAVGFFLYLDPWKFTVATDVTWAMGPLFIWSTIEPGVAIITACLPHLAPLFKLATRKMTSYNSENTGAGGASGKLQRLDSGSGRQKRSGNRAPNFDFGLTTLGTQGYDDEIGLTKIRSRYLHVKRGVGASGL